MEAKTWQETVIVPTEQKLNQMTRQRVENLLGKLICNASKEEIIKTCSAIQQLNLAVNAEISFKAGQHSLLTEKQLTEHDDMVYQAGIREVVEWIEKRDCSYHLLGEHVHVFKVVDDEWITKLKEWGIEK